MAGGFYSAKVGERPETPAPSFRAEGDAIDVKEALRSFREDAVFFDDQRQEFLRLYPEQWVGVYDKHVAGADADLKTLLRDMKLRSYPLESVVVRHVTAKRMKRILAAQRGRGYFPPSHDGSNPPPCASGMNEKGDMMNVEAERGGAPRRFWRRSIPDGRPRPAVKIVRRDPNDPESIRIKAELKRFGEDHKYFSDRYREMLERYPEHWIAVYNKEVVGADTDFKRLLEDLKARGYPLAKLAVNKATAEKVVWRFWRSGD